MKKWKKNNKKKKKKKKKQKQKKTNLLTCANSGQKVPFSFLWIKEILTSVYFTTFCLEQPEIKISKSFQINIPNVMSIGSQTDTQN